MGIIKKDFKYKVINNFLTKEETILLEKYCICKHRYNKESFDLKQSKVGDTYFYADPLMQSLMVCKKELMEKETGLKLFPTYAFWRMYTMFADLKKQKDRPSCEISVTVQIGSCGTPWSIFMDGNEVKLNNGDAVVYLGCELDHWREEFTGDWHAQTFLHYVDQDGPFADYKNDKNPLIGCEYENNK